MRPGGRRRQLWLSILVVVAGAVGTGSAVAKGPPPPFTATAAVTLTGVGDCPGTATVKWKNVRAGVSRIDYAWFFNGVQVDGTFSNFGSTKSGTDVQGLTVQNGATFIFTATVYSDPAGTNVLATLTRNAAACNA
jgi:hypothetical protein